MSSEFKAKRSQGATRWYLCGSQEFVDRARVFVLDGEEHDLSSMYESKKKGYYKFTIKRRKKNESIN